MTVTRYVYETQDGDPWLRVVRRDTAKGKRIHQERPGEFGGWEKGGRNGPHPIYRLKSIAAADPSLPVIVVEGEKCADALAEHMPGRAVVCWLGGTVAPLKTDWEPLRGRKALLIADGDDPGHRAMQQLAAHLHAMNCWTTLVLSPLDKTDVADWLTGGGIEAVNQKVAANQVEWVQIMPSDDVPPVGDQIDQILDPALDAISSETLQTNEHYRVLGVSEGGYVHFEWADSRVPVSYPSNKLFAKDTLCTLAPEEWWRRLMTRGVFTNQEARSCGGSILSIARGLGIYDPTAVLGRGAARLDDGEVVWHLGDRLLLPDGSETTELERCDQKFGPATPVKLVASATDAQMCEFASAVLGYRWRSVQDGRRFLGWMVTALVGGALKWRPHIHLIAPATSGKTWLLEEVVKGVFGSVGHLLVDTTEAGLARGVGSDAVPIVLDEAEPPMMERVLSVLRGSAGGGGQRWRASAAGGGIDVQALRFSAMLAATATVKLGRADASRLVSVEFGPKVPDWPKVEARILAAAGNGQAIRSRIIRDASRIVSDAQAVGVSLRKKGIGSREAASSGALTAGWSEWGVERLMVRANVEVDDHSNDAADCLRELLETVVRTGGSEVSLWRLLCASTAGDGRLAEDLGLRRDQSGLLVAYEHSGLSRQLRLTRWAQHDLCKLLEQLPGIGVRTQTRWAEGRTLWCLWVSPGLLAECGFVFPTVATDQQEF